MTRSIPRRNFIKKTIHTAAAGMLGPMVIPAGAFARTGRSPNDRINLAVIGVGGMGTQHLRVMLRNPGVHIPAICDVYEPHRMQAKARVDDRYENEDCVAYNDFRAVLDRDDIDAILIGSPDHWHIPISIAAFKAGKDVYSEKPLTHTINEGKALVKAVKRYGRVFQTGTQQRSSVEFRFACELVRRGMLGKLHTVELHLPPGNSCEWTPDREPPPGLDWDLWLGPAPWVPFNPRRHPGGFRFFWDYSGGSLTDWGAHHSDVAQWGIGMDGSGPISVEGKGVLPAEGNFETFLDYNITWEYPNGVKMVTVHPEHGLRFIGTDGWVHVWRGGIEAEPRELLRTVIDQDERSLYIKPAQQQQWQVWASPGHHADWLDCIRTRRQPVCNAEVGHRSVTVCHLGNIAMRLGRKLNWDPVKEEFIGDDEANTYLSRPYRAPWRL